MIKHWKLNNNELIPPEYHLKHTPEAKKWISDLNKGGIIYEQTGDYSYIRHSINVGIVKGFINRALRYKHKIEADFSLPQQLTEEGIKERNIIVRRLSFIRNYLKLIKFISIPLIMLSTFNLCLGLVMSMILYQLLI